MTRKFPFWVSESDQWVQGVGDGKITQTALLQKREGMVVACSLPPCLNRVFIKVLLRALIEKKKFNPYFLVILFLLWIKAVVCISGLELLLDFLVLLSSFCRDVVVENLSILYF